MVKRGVLAEDATFKGVSKEARGEDDNRFSAEHSRQSYTAGVLYLPSVKGNKGIQFANKHTPRL